MNGELWGVGKTFILTIIAIVVTGVLIALGKVPEVISVEAWSALVLALMAPYAVKSGLSKRNGG